MSQRILATADQGDCVGRCVEMEVLRRHCAGASKSNGLLLLSAPVAGASELLKQFYDELFHAPGETIPIYFAVSETDQSAKDCARRFLNAFLAQTAAFRRRDPNILNTSSNLTELTELTAPVDLEWVERLLANRLIDEASGDDRAGVRGCLNAPLRGAAHGVKFFVMIDETHETAHLTGEINFFEELKNVYARAQVPFVFAGRRRFLHAAARTGNTFLSGAENLRLALLSDDDAGLLTENLARRLNVKITEPARDLIVQKFRGSPVFIKFFLQAASVKRLNLDSFERVEQLYADELFGGATGRFYDAIFKKIAPHSETQRSLVNLLYKLSANAGEKALFESWQKELDLNDADFHRVTSLLNTAEIISVSSNVAEAMCGNETLDDYLTARFRLEIAAENRALVVGEMLVRFLKRTPQTLAKFYRRHSAVGLRELLSAFDHQETPLALFDYTVFRQPFQATNATECGCLNKQCAADDSPAAHCLYGAHIGFLSAAGKFDGSGAVGGRPRFRAVEIYGRNRNRLAGGGN